MNDIVSSIQIEDVDRETHRHGMHTAARDDPQSLTCAKTSWCRCHQAAQPGPVRVRDEKLSREKFLPCSVKGIPRRNSRDHSSSRSLLSQLFSARGQEDSD